MDENKAADEDRIAKVLADFQELPEFKEGSQFALFRLLGLLAPPPKILYHYTSMQALVSIVESGRIRASHIRFLNDASEATVIWQAILRRLSQRAETASKQDEKDFFARISTLAPQSRLSNEFIASFSETGDDLSQWRAYCAGGSGFSIGFESAALRSQWVSNPDSGKGAFVGAQLLKVRYLQDEDTSSIDAAINDLASAASQFSGTTGFANRTISRDDAFMSWLSLINPTYKDRAFSQESEWRLILSKPHEPMPHQRFRPGKSTLIPYVEVDLNRDLKFEPAVQYMIKRVIVGPTPNAALSLEALRHLFISKGQPQVEIVQSAIPYRDW